MAKHSLETLGLPKELVLDGLDCRARFNDYALRYLRRQELGYWTHEPIGVGTLTQRAGNSEFKIMGLNVHPSHRARGIGKIIIGLLEDMAEIQGATRMILDSVPPAIGFYEKMGYEDLGLSPEPGLRHNQCHRMTKELVATQSA